MKFSIYMNRRVFVMLHIENNQQCLIDQKSVKTNLERYVI